MIKLINLLKEALTISTAKELYSIPKSHNIIQKQKDIFEKIKSSPEYVGSNRNGDRLYFKFSQKENNNLPSKTSSKISSDIIDFLLKNNYKVKDYIKGIAIDKYDREIKIGKILNKLNPNLLQLFNNDPNREASKEKEQLIVISKNPYDIGGASTDRGWDSCFNIEHGEHADEIYCGIKNGLIISYLISKKDLNINRPQARLLINSYINNKTKDIIFIPASHIQGTAPEYFKKYIDEMFEKFSPEIGVYYDPINKTKLDLKKYKNKCKFLYKLKNNIPFSKDELKMDDLILVGKDIEYLPNNLDIKNLVSLVDNPKLTSLPDDIKIGGDLWLKNTGIESLPKNIKINDISLGNTPLAKKYKNDPDEIRKAYPNIKGEIYLHTI